MADRLILHVDPQSPYAYLADARAERVLGVEPELRCLTLGAIFQRRGSGSWARTDARAAGIAEIERRAAAYGLPPVAWPPGWPAGSIVPARAGAWAERHGALRPFLRALWRRGFARGEDMADVAVLAAAATDAGLDGDALEAGLTEPETKTLLRERTDSAWDAGVRGVPTLQAGDQLFFGDDRLEEAARALSARR